MSDIGAPALPWLRLWAADHLTSTRGLSLAERGALLDLLLISWATGPLPTDQARLARLLGVSARELKAVWPAIENRFVETLMGYVNVDLERERAEAMRIHANASARAAAGAKARWGKVRREIQGVANTLSNAASNAPSSARADLGDCSSSAPLPPLSPPPLPKEGGVERKRTRSVTTEDLQKLRAAGFTTPHAMAQQLKVDVAAIQAVEQTGVVQ